MTEPRAFDSAVVLGAGAVGSFLGSLLSRALPTVLVGRPQHVAAITNDGLRLSGELDETVRVDCVGSEECLNWKCEQPTTSTSTKKQYKT